MVQLVYPNKGRKYMNFHKNQNNQINDMMDALKEERKEVSLSGKEEPLAQQEAKKFTWGFTKEELLKQEEDTCAECNLFPKTHSSYCHNCWKSKME